jgi:hypothetical protein
MVISTFSAKWWLFFSLMTHKKLPTFDQKKSQQRCYTLRFFVSLKIIERQKRGLNVINLFLLIDKVNQSSAFQSPYFESGWKRAGSELVPSQE